MKIKHLTYPFTHHRQTRTAQNARNEIPVMQNMTIPSGSQRYISPSPAAKLPNRHTSTISSASLIFFAVCSINTVFSIIHLAFQSPEGMTSACSGRWFMV